MSEHAELAERLRKLADKHSVADFGDCCDEAADAIEAVETKVERLENHKDVLATALQQSEEARIAAMRERDEALETSLVHLARAEEAEKHEAIAVADNAALFELDVEGHYGIHPGAAVMARMARLEAVKDATQAFLDWMGDGEEYEVRLAPVRAALDAAESEAK